MSGEGDDGGQEKIHEPTERKLAQAREEGDLPQSQDAQTLAAYAGLAAVLALTGAASAERLGGALAPLLDRPEELAALAFAEGAPLLPFLGVEIAAAALPVLLVPAALVLAFLVARRGIVVAPSKVLPKLSRISPVDNARQKYGAHGLGEFVKSAVKLCLLLAVLAFALAAERHRLGQYVHVEGRMIGRLLDRQLWSILGGALAVAAVLGVVDLFWQGHLHRKRHRMTHEDMKKESRETEGDPYQRAARLERARAIATNRMLDGVKDAAVVIVNPTHFAVALAWERGSPSAPVCVAKGMGEIALRIRERAEAAGVPVQRDPPTARLIHATVGIGQEVRPEQYRAVAAAILFADDMRRKRAGRPPVGRAGR